MKTGFRSLGFAAGLNIAVLLSLGAVAPAFASCGSAYCTINTNWDLQNGWAEPGARVDLRYEAINQNQPRKGGHNVSVGEVPRHHDEIRTRNQNWLGSFDYTFNADWGVSVLASFVDREHKHIHNHHGEEIRDYWHFSTVGDTRVIGRYRLPVGGQGNPDGSGTFGLNFGVKLPTGRFNLRNGDGDLAERSLQPGTGTTDALLGGFASGDLPIADWSWFAQGLVQLPLNARDDYKPGKRFALDAGVRYDVNERWSLMLQVNGLKRTRDSGIEAEPEDSGGYSVWLGPGASYAVTRDVRAYGFLQLPVVQHVNGVQLVANKAVVLGVSARF